MKVLILWPCQKNKIFTGGRAEGSVHAVWQGRGWSALNTRAPGSNKILIFFLLKIILEFGHHFEFCETFETVEMFSIEDPQVVVLRSKGYTAIPCWMILESEKWKWKLKVEIESESHRCWFEINDFMYTLLNADHGFWNQVNKSMDATN